MRISPSAPSLFPVQMCHTVIKISDQSTGMLLKKKILFQTVISSGYKY